MIEIAPGVHPVPFWLPLVVSFLLTLVMSPAGVSGAFLLLPFQVSVLGFTGPGVTPTNHLFNVVAIPSGAYRYAREKRMLWPLAAVILAGTVPGVVFGSLARIYLLPDARRFKLLIAFVLLLIGWSLVRRLLQRWRGGPPVPAPAGRFEVEVLRADFRRLEYRFDGVVHRVSMAGLGALTVVIGMIGGAYGVGGGAIIAPLLVTLFRLPVHSITGATLLGTWVTSLVAVTLFVLHGLVAGGPGGAAVGPNWTLGLLFGAGGLLGMYGGARLQRHLPARWIEAVLAVVVSGLAIAYVVGFFTGRG